MKNVFYLLFGGFLFMSLHSCTDKLDESLHHYTDEEFEILTRTLNIPEGTYDYSIVTNIPIQTNPDLPFHKATLGRVLFYDKMLSVDESTSCASCHKQELAFADDSKFSEGLNGQIGTRNSLPLGNTIGFVRYYGTDLQIPSGQFSWDESKVSINEQSKAAIVSPIEMGHDMWDLVQSVNEQDYYQVLFKKVYGNQGATQENILDALTEFVNSFSSRESLFDQAVAQTNNVYNNSPLFSDSQNNGKALFNTHCGNCHDVNHNAIIMTAANNGLDMVYEDKGMGEKTSDPNYNGVFKVPSLRNIELTGPYMHDGRFETLEEVIEHYSTGIVNHPNLHNFLKNGNSAQKFNFTTENKRDLVEYLKTLTDDVFIADVKYSDPFK
ncbi:MAG: cytochrome c peroxidase [Saprospiraceae bacterium]|nr:cytochrome c peroxidase [Saprospiraceae bacterium]